MTGFSPYELVFGKNVVFPVEFEIKTLRTALAVNLDLTDAQTARLQQLQELDEKRLDAIHQTTMIQPLMLLELSAYSTRSPLK